MWFWIFMLVMNIWLPIFMIGFGRYFLKHAPKEINPVFGYRTSMSMKNQETWQFAHHYMGRLWYISGLILLPLSAVLMLPLLGKDTETVGMLGSLICITQVVVVIGEIIPTEMALHKKFDKQGRPRETVGTAVAEKGERRV
ncbi:MAG: SdpI family protein [Lachnospiraceae bacterium]